MADADGGVAAEQPAPVPSADGGAEPSEQPPAERTPRARAGLRTGCAATAGPEEEETMTTVREGIEQAVLLSIGAAALTRERAEAAVAELVRKGQVGGEEGAVVVDRLMARVRGEGASTRRPA